MTKSLALLLLLIFTTSLLGKPSLIPNFDLLRDYSFDLQKMKPFTPPYLVQFSKGDYQLIYLAADHTRDPESNTFKLISLAMKKFDPEIVIIEGFPSVKGEGRIKNAVEQYFITKKRTPPRADMGRI